MKKQIICLLTSGVGCLGFLKVCKNTSLYFTDAEAINFINYLRSKNALLGASNGFVLFTISAAVICIYINKLNKIKNAKKVG